MVNPDSVTDMVESIEKVLCDKVLYETLQNRGLKHVQKYSWEKTARETLKIYNKIVQM